MFNNEMVFMDVTKLIILQNRHENRKNVVHKMVRERRNKMLGPSHPIPPKTIHREKIIILVL